MLLAALMTAHGGEEAQAKKRAKLHGTVWSDTDRDGVRETGEPGLSGVAIVVQRRSGKRFVRYAKRTTNAKGVWSVPVRRRATLRVRVLLPPGSAGFSPANAGPEGKDSDVAAGGLAAAAATASGLKPRGRSRRIDAGVMPAAMTGGSSTTPAPAPEPGPAPAPDPVAQPDPLPEPEPEPSAAPVTGTAWTDTDSDGIRDIAESGRPGVAVELWDTARTTMLTSTTSAADGTWSLTPPADGSYRVRLVLPAQTIYSPALQGGVPSVDSDIAVSGANAGFSGIVTQGTGDVGAGIRTGSAITLGNRAWRDSGDGLQGPSPSGAYGAVFELWNDNLTQLLDTATSDSSGLYSLDAVANGVYRVRVTAYPGWVLGPPNVGSDDADDSDFGPLGAKTSTIALTPAASTVTLDAGFVTEIHVGNLVWHDVNGNGQQDTGEPGMAGITVQLWNGTKTALLDTATTNASGIYSLQAPGPGDYRVRVLLPGDGTVFTVKDAGGDDLKDSDINPTGTSFGFTDTYVFASNLISITSIDAGLST